MNKSVLLSALLLALSFSSCAKVKFPKYADVVYEFNNEYKLRENQKHREIRFLKHPDGYFIEEYSYGLDTYVNKQLFWSSNSGRFKKVDFPDGGVLAEDFAGDILSRWGVRFYDLFPYYGYVGWEKDVIDFLESKRKLSDDDIFALGRAYSFYASNLVNNNSGFADSATMFKLNEFDGNQLSDKQLSKYRNYRHKAIEQYEKLSDRNADYKTIVGSITTKCYNEYLVSFVDLRVLHNEEEAQKELPDGLYSPFYREMAKNYLNSCDSNAILFTNGDNDTYPILYMQAKEGYRTDVLVVNLALLANSNYTNHLRRGKILNADSLSMVLLPSSYAGNKLGYAPILGGGNDVFVELREVFGDINNESLQSGSYGNLNYYNIESEKFKFDIDHGQTVEFSLNVRYLDRNEIIALDVISSNISHERPVYFVFDETLGLKDYLELNGFVYKIVHQTNKISGSKLWGSVNASRTFYHIMSDLDIDESIPITGGRMVVGRNYINSFSHVAEYYSNQGEVDSCRLIIDKYMELLPNTVYSMDYYTIPIVEAAYRVGLNKKADYLTSIIIKNIQERIEEGDISLREKDIIGYTSTTLYSVVKNEELRAKAKELYMSLE